MVITIGIIIGLLFPLKQGVFTGDAAIGADYMNRAYNFGSCAPVNANVGSSWVPMYRCSNDNTTCYVLKDKAGANNWAGVSCLSKIRDY